MKIEIKEMNRASEGDTIELEGNIIRTLKPNEGEYGWSQFIVIKDATGEQGAWLKLEGDEDKVTKGSSIKVKGKVGKEYKDSKGVMKRSLNNCEFEVNTKAEVSHGGSTGGNGSNGTKDNYWEKKFEWDKHVQFVIIRECAIKSVTELAKITPSKTFLIKVHTEKDFFEFADKIRDYICKKITSEDIIATLGGEIIGTSKDGKPVVKTGTKEERIETAREAVGDTEFRPASTAQKKKIFGYRDEKGWHKGMIESRYITKEEIREIGSPDKLSLEKASEKLGWWWGVGEEIGERDAREIIAKDQGEVQEPLVKGDKTSLVKDILVDKIYALRRENFLNDDEKFDKEIGYNPKIEELTEKELEKLKEILEHYHPANWDEEDDKDYIAPEKLD